MTTSRLAAAAPGGAALRDTAPVLLAGLLGLVVWGLLFHAEAVAAVRVWYDSTAYSHCFFILPIAVWLAWDRRPAARGLRPHPAAAAHPQKHQNSSLRPPGHAIRTGARPAICFLICF